MTSMADSALVRTFDKAHYWNIRKHPQAHIRTRIRIRTMGTQRQRHWRLAAMKVQSQTLRKKIASHYPLHMVSELLVRLFVSAKKPAERCTIPACQHNRHDCFPAILAENCSESKVDLKGIEKLRRGNEVEQKSPVLLANLIAMAGCAR